MATPAVLLAPPLVKQVLELLQQSLLVAAEVRGLLRVQAVVRGQELLGGLPPGAQLLASLLADLGGRTVCGPLTTAREHDVAAVTVAAGLVERA
jgi:hypothetical protein